MAVVEPLNAPPPEVVVQLFDLARGAPIKTWRFAARPQITIGRSEGCDVEICDPYVSRLHAELAWGEGKWTLTSRGRNGVLVANRPITEIPLQHEVLFQLGAAGPTFRFRAEDVDENCNRTLSYDFDPLPEFQLDESKLRAEIGEIEEGDYFRQLLAQAQTLRRGRTE
jgi:pSer/pThr/pTyr-binding forkhead associated (FHA) protein